MYKHIVVPMALDHDISEQTLEVAHALLAPGGRITGLHVYETPQGSVSAYLDEDAVKKSYETAGKRLKEKLAHAEGVVPALVTGHSSRTIVDYADENGADCIVIGSHKPGIRDYFLGSTASHVVRHAKCAVHVQRDNG